MGIAQRRGGDGGLPRTRALNSAPIYGSIVTAAHKSHFANFLFDQFQIALLPDWNTIKLAHKVGIIPVGVRPFYIS
jgi:hypothetical protein